MVLAGSRREEVDAMNAEIQRLRARQEHFEEQLRLVTVVSPIDGIVATPKLKDRVGQAVDQGDLIAEVHEMETVTIEIAVPEKEIADVAVGRKMFLKAQAYPGTALRRRRRVHRPGGRRARRVGPAAHHAREQSIAQSGSGAPAGHDGAREDRLR